MGPASSASAAVLKYGHGPLDIVSDYVLLREARTLIAPDSSPDDKALCSLGTQVRQQLQAADPRLLPFDLALINNGKNPERWLEGGRARAILGQSELAEADLNKAAEIAPGDPEMLASRCLIYAELNRLKEALADLARLMEEKADPAKASAHLAAQQRLFNELGQWPALFERITQIRPSDPLPWIGRARYRLSPVAHAGAQDGDAAGQAIADLRKAVARGFRDFNQLNNDAFWQPLKARQDFQLLLTDMAERNADELLLMARLEGHTELVRGVAFLPDGQRLVSVGRDKVVRTWDLETRSVLSSFAVEGYLRDADISADGRLVGMVSNEGTTKGLAHVWDLEKQERLGEFVQEFKWAEGIRMSPGGAHVVTSGKPARGVLWDLSTGKEQQQFKLENTAEGFATAFSPDGRLLAYGTVGYVHLFDVASGTRLSRIRLGKNRFIERMVFSGGVVAHLAPFPGNNDVHLINSTISGNKAPADVGGGVAIRYGAAVLRNSIVLAPFATVADVDSPDFSGGRLRVRIDEIGASSSNRLSIGSGFTVDASSNVRLNGVIIGKRTANGFATNELIATFNANATKGVVQQLVRAITFKTVVGAAGQRKVVFTVSDGDGGLSSEAVKTVNVG